MSLKLDVIVHGVRYPLALINQLPLDGTLELATTL